MTAPSAGTEVPPFRMLFPPGWTRHQVAGEDERDLMAAMREKIRPYGRPDLEFQLTAAIKTSFRELRSHDGIALYLPTRVEASALVPMSLIAMRLADPAGGTLDGHAADLVRNHGAEFLGDDHTILRWRRTVSRIRGMEGGLNEQVNYLVPVPRTDRRVAVLLSTSIVQSSQDPMTEDDLDACIELSDAVVSTFAWARTVGPA